MEFFCLANGVAAGAAASRQRHRHRPGRDMPSQQLRRRRSSLVHAGMGIFFTLWLTSSSLAPPQDANRGVQEAVPCFRAYAYAAPAGATVAAKASLAAHSRSGRSALGRAASDREAGFAWIEENHWLLDAAQLGVVQNRAAAAGPVVGSSVVLPGDEASAGEREAVVEQTASATPAKSVLPETHSTRGGKQMYAQRMDAPAFIQQHAEHGQQATGSKPVECSCEIAGNCLPKGSCVAVACVLVAFSIVAVFLLAWLLQWLSAIPSEWVLAKRFRRRSLNFFSERGPTGGKKKDDAFRPLSTAVTVGEQEPQHVQRGGAPSPDEPLLEERQTEAVDSLQGERGISERYENATPVPKTENGRL